MIVPPLLQQSVSSDTVDIFITLHKRQSYTLHFVGTRFLPKTWYTLEYVDVFINTIATNEEVAEDLARKHIKETFPNILFPRLIDIK